MIGSSPRYHMKNLLRMIFVVLPGLVIIFFQYFIGVVDKVVTSFVRNCTLDSKKNLSNVVALLIHLQEDLVNQQKNVSHLQLS